MQQRKARPRVFISYSWDNDEHKEWVLTLADKLKEDDVDIKLDRYDMYAGRNLHTFIEDNIEKADKIIVVFTPIYRQKAEGRTNYAGAEYSIINVGLYQEIATQEKIIPIFRLGSMKECLPLFMQQFLSIDFSDPKSYQEKYEELLKAIFGWSQAGSSNGVGKNIKPSEDKNERKTGVVTFFNKNIFWENSSFALGLIAAVITIWQYAWPVVISSESNEPPVKVASDTPSSKKIIRDTPTVKKDTPDKSKTEDRIAEKPKTIYKPEPKVKKIEYDHIGFPVNGICLVEERGRYGFINSDSNNIDGSKVVEMKYDFAEDFSEGLAKVKRHGLYGYINTTGKLVINYQFDNAWSFVGGKAKVRRDGESFSINKYGERIDQ